MLVLWSRGFSLSARIGTGANARGSRRILHAAIAQMIQGDRADGAWLEFRAYFPKCIRVGLRFPPFSAFVDVACLGAKL